MWRTASLRRVGVPPRPGRRRACPGLSCAGDRTAEGSLRYAGARQLGMPLGTLVEDGEVTGRSIVVPVLLSIIILTYKCTCVWERSPHVDRPRILLDALQGACHAPGPIGQPLDVRDGLGEKRIRRELAEEIRASCLGRYPDTADINDGRVGT